MCGTSRVDNKSERMRKMTNVLCCVHHTSFCFTARSHGAMVARLSSKQKVAGSIPIVVRHTWCSIGIKLSFKHNVFILVICALCMHYTFYIYSFTALYSLHWISWPSHCCHATRKTLIIFCLSPFKDYTYL